MRMPTSRSRRLVAGATALLVLVPAAIAAAAEAPTGAAAVVVDPAPAPAPEVPVDEPVDPSLLLPCVIAGTPEAVGYEGCVTTEEWVDGAVTEPPGGAYPDVPAEEKAQWPRTSTGGEPLHCEKGVAPDGATTFACIEPGPAPSEDVLQSMIDEAPATPTEEAKAQNFEAGAAGPSAAPGASARAHQPLRVVRPPAECLRATDKPRITRLNSCFYSTGTMVFSEITSGGAVTVLGTFVVNELVYVYTDPRNSQVFNQTSLKVTNRTGIATSGLTLSGNFVCTTYCDGKRGSLPSRTVGTQTIYAVGKLEPVLARGTKSNIFSNWSFTYAKAGHSSETFSSKALTPRCDNNAVYGLGRGCVFPEGRVSLVYSKSNVALDEVARHIGLAQESGLPSTLTRNTPSQVIANRRAACPGSLTRPPGKECDEYPFASTVQGGASGGTARVFDGCDLTIIPGSGATGFSRCMVTKSDNRVAGRAILDLYYEKRVLPGDKYTVLITP